MLAVIGWKSVLCFSLHIFRALAASCVLYNRTEPYTEKPYTEKLRYGPKIHSLTRSPHFNLWDN